ncbi:MAG: response regulator [candidate division Zixibacteria bacterium]|nr:response regulator [candidate division Zixibacteria bacterium]
MSSEQILGFIWLVLTLSSFIFYSLVSNRANWRLASSAQRLRLSVAGGALTLAALINWLKAFDNFSLWFVPAVYPVLNGALIVLALVGSGILIWSIINGDFKGHSLGDDTESVTGQLAGETPHASSSENYFKLERLRGALSQPFPFVEMAGLSLQTALEILDGAKGAIYIYNENDSQMALVAAQGLSDKEQFYLERIPLRLPAVSECLQSGSPLLSVALLESLKSTVSQSEQIEIDFLGRTISCVILPFVHAGKPLGMALALREGSATLTPAAIAIAESLCVSISEKFQLTRLRGELLRERRKSEERSEEFRAWRERLRVIVDCLENRSDYRRICEELMGVGGADQVAFLELDSLNDTLSLPATSAGFPPLTPGYTFAIKQALKRQSLVLLNREKETSESASRPNLLVPKIVTNQKITTALVAGLGTFDNDSLKKGLIIWNSSGELSLTKSDVSAIGLTASLISFLIRSRESEKLSQINSRSIHNALELLREKELTDNPERGARNFFKYLIKTLPEDSRAILFDYKPDIGILPAHSHGISSQAIRGLLISPGEGQIGRAVSLGVVSSEKGALRMDELFAEYSAPNREIFGERFSSLGEPKAQIVAPLEIPGHAQFALAVYLQNTNDVAEIAQTLEFMTAFFTLKNSLTSANSRRGPSISADATAGDSGAEFDLAINDLNNELSVALGEIQLTKLANMDGALVPDLIERLSAAEKCVERAGEIVRSGALRQRPVNKAEIKPDATSIQPVVSLKSALESFARRRLVGGTILLVEGRAREIRFDLPVDFTLSAEQGSVDRFVEEVMRTFAGFAAEEEVLTVSTYQSGEYICLDINRLKKGRKAVSRVLEFGIYVSSSSAQHPSLPTALFDTLKELKLEVALDARDGDPQYISIQQKVTATTPENAASQKPKKTLPRIMAIDDQPMILDLLQGMCQSLGYTIDTFSNPEQALERFERDDYNIILSDIAMPELSGWDVAARVKALRPAAYVIFITGWGDKLDDETLRLSGVDQVLYKPFRIEQLTLALDKAQRAISDLSLQN